MKIKPYHNWKAGEGRWYGSCIKGQWETDGAQKMILMTNIIARWWTHEHKDHLYDVICFGELIIYRGGKHKFLGMYIEFFKNGIVLLLMKNYIEESIV